jgi:ADP-heptose:LPS heptosyltransferase
VKILVLNLTRFGDLLQTSPTIVGLRTRHPDAHVTVCVERNFADVCRGLPAVDRVWEIDLDALGRLLLEDGPGGLRAAYGRVAETVEALRAERFDLALNYSSSRMSAVLMGLLGVPDTRGWTMTRDGHRLIAHPWSRLFSASALTRRLAPFNLVDYYQRIAGVVRGPDRLFFDVPADAERAIDGFLAGAGWRGERLVALQLGASRASRRWPARSFVALARAVGARLPARFVLCGGGGEREVAREIAAALGTSAIDACGRTTVAELAGLLRRAEVLVTGDTGPMHLAIAVGTPVAALFFGPALPADTGPYARDQLCLRAEVACAPCDHSVTCLAPFCRDTLAPEAVAEAVVARVAGDWDALGVAADRWPEIGWYRTGFDAEGLFDLTRLGSGPEPAGERLRRAYRALWKRAFDGTPARPLATPLPDVAARARELGLVAVGAVRLAARIAAAVDEEPVDCDALEAAARELEGVDADIVRLGAVHAALAPLVQLFRFEKESLEGDDVRALAAATRALHERLAAHAALLAELVDARTEMRRPAAAEEERHGCLG